MAYMVWLLTGIAVLIGFFLGIVLGIRRDLHDESVGTIFVGYTGEEDDGAHLFLDLDEDISGFETNDYVVLRIRKVKARK